MFVEAATSLQGGKPGFDPKAPALHVQKAMRIAEARTKCRQELQAEPHDQHAQHRQSRGQGRRRRHDLYEHVVDDQVAVAGIGLVGQQAAGDVRGIGVVEGQKRRITQIGHACGVGGPTQKGNYWRMRAWRQTTG